jgi:intracellular sulfur oxidation DsrE/DsrF family protein
MCRKMIIAVALVLPLAIGTVALAGPDESAGKAANLLAPVVHPKVVFQINQATDAPTILRFVTNYLIAEPAAEVAVVGYAGGVDFMLKGAMDAAGKPYADQVKVLADKGVAFKVCNNTLKTRGLTADAVAPAVTVVPGAVNEIIRLQTREGYAYFRH